MVRSQDPNRRRPPKAPIKLLHNSPPSENRSLSSRSNLLPPLSVHKSNSHSSRLRSNRRLQWLWHLVGCFRGPLHDGRVGDPWRAGQAVDQLRHQHPIGGIHLHRKPVNAGLPVIENSHDHLVTAVRRSPVAQSVRVHMLASCSKQTRVQASLGGYVPQGAGCRRA